MSLWAVGAQPLSEEALQHSLKESKINFFFLYAFKTTTASVQKHFKSQQFSKLL